ncbi:hypothetical protein BU17DRAFT_94630 [Hysterangium stoloniferum]|nr:hypothetical protein BU17DRAFT_94630 [Hysterangium stoloniferum]
MDHRKSPEFSLDNSPPNFAYDFSADSASSNSAAFEAFASSYTVYPASPPRMDFASLALTTPQSPHQPSFFSSHYATHGNAVNAGGSPNSLTSISDGGHRPLTPLEGATISPPLTYPQGGSDLDGMDDTPGTGATSPTAGRAPSHTTRGSARYNPMATRAARPAARKSAAVARRNMRRDEDDMSDEEVDVAESTLGMELGGTSSEIITHRREEIRRQRIESEQRRRDELREGYARLKHTLPVSNQKSSKVSLLDRAVVHIRHLETAQANIQSRLNTAEEELRRQRDVNEGLMRTLTEQHRAVTLPALAAAHAASVSEPPSPPGQKKGKKSAF